MNASLPAQASLADQIGVCRALPAGRRAMQLAVGDSDLNKDYPHAPCLAG